MIRSRNLLHVLLVAVVGLPSGTAAATENAVTTVDNVAEIETLDEVVVSGRLRTLAEVRQALIRAENDFYGRFNDLNKDDAFDISCRDHAPTGSRMLRRYCMPQRVEDEARMSGLQILGVVSGSVRVQTPDEIRRAINGEIQRRMRQMVDSDPELLLALLQHARLTEMYQNMQKEKFAGGRKVVWE